MIRNVKSHSDMVSLWCEFLCYLSGHLSFHGKHIWQYAHTDMVSLWYEFLWFFVKPFSAILTLIWFLFGMSSYVILCKTLFCNAHTDYMVSLWYGVLMWFFCKPLFCNAHTDMVSLWYEFLHDSFAKLFPQYSHWNVFTLPVLPAGSCILLVSSFLPCRKHRQGLVSYSFLLYPAGDTGRVLYLTRFFFLLSFFLSFFLSSGKTSKT